MSRAWFERRTEPPVVAAFPRASERPPRLSLVPPSAGRELDPHVQELERARSMVATLEARVVDAEIENQSLQRALDEARASAASDRASLEARIEASERARDEETSAFEQRLVALAFAIARKVVGRELAADPELVATWAREAAATLGEGATVTTSADTCVVRAGAKVIEVSAEARLEALQEAVDEAA